MCLVSPILFVILNTECKADNVCQSLQQKKKKKKKKEEEEEEEVWALYIYDVAITMITC